MEVLENFKDLFIDVWKEGISGVNISEIIIALIIFIFFLFLRGVFSKFVILIIKISPELSPFFLILMI